MMFRPMPVLTVLTLISLGILVWLGNWQYARFGQKMAQPTMVEVEADAVERTVLIDTANPGMAQQVYGVLDGEPVWRRYVPGRVEGSGELVLVLWDATGGPLPVALPIAKVTEPYRRVSNQFMRSGKRGLFANKDQPEKDLWFTFDPAAMAERLGYGAVALPVVETLSVTVRNSEDMSRARRAQNPYAFETVRDPLPAERHFGYALTWWGMALGLLGVYIALHAARGRLRLRRVK